VRENRGAPFTTLFFRFLLNPLLSVALRCEEIEEHPDFEALVTGAIIVAGGTVGLQTAYNWPALAVTDVLTTLIFVSEAFIKIAAKGSQPLLYFQDAWNVFDFSIVLATVVPEGLGALGVDLGPAVQDIRVLRLLRLLRAVKLLNAVPQLQLIVLALVQGVRSMGYISLIVILVYYVFAVTAMIFFAQNDPWRFVSLHMAMLTLFQCATLDDWTDVM
jgi:voltage-gated sodium channel